MSTRMDDITLLREYAGSNSEKAFETLVSRHVNFVYSTAMRQLGDAHSAEEITQAVFVILAQKAGRISDQANLMGWLFKTTRYVVLAENRAAAKRQRAEESLRQTDMEMSAPNLLWEQMSPWLDQALAQLGERDRQAVLLRFFQNKSLAEVGSTLGTGEDTARKRVSRALEKLRRFLVKRGVASTTAVIAGLISSNSVQAAPAALAKTVGGFVNRWLCGSSSNRANFSVTGDVRREYRIKMM
jgi:RNA polymerase sigma factor (sigma-70 family)